MSESRPYGLGNKLDMDQIRIHAQHRWLHPAEICNILRNYNNLRIEQEQANRPSSGSLFLFYRKVKFRNDGYNWRMRSYGKSREAQETEEAVPLSQETEDILANSEMDISLPLQTTDIIDNAQASEYEDGELVSAITLWKDVLGNGTSGSQELGSYPEVQEEWQTSEHTDQNVHSDSAYDDTLLDSVDPCLIHSDEHMQIDSFSRANVNESHMQSSSGAHWNTVESENVVEDNYVLGSSLSQDQLISITDFSPNWKYEFPNVNESHMQSSSGAHWNTVESENVVEDIVLSPIWAYEGSGDF